MDDVALIYFSYRHYYGTCQCQEEGGQLQEFGHDDGLWCCKSTAKNCTVVESYSDGDPKTVICTGKKLELSQQCHDQDSNTPICNHYGGDQWRNGDTFIYHAKRSHLNICNHNR